MFLEIFCDILRELCTEIFKVIQPPIEIVEQPQTLSLLVLQHPQHSCALLEQACFVFPHKLLTEPFVEGIQCRSYIEALIEEIQLSLVKLRNC